MTITITSRHILKALYVLSWIIFIGLGIEAGALIFYAVLSVARPESAEHLWQRIDLLDLLQHDRGEFLVLMFNMIIVALARATMFYLIIKIIHDKKLDIVQPFNISLVRLIQKTAYLALLIGLFSQGGTKYANWLAAKGISIPDTQHLRLAGADVWFFMGITLIVIAQIFKRGIEIQTENELTV